MATHPKKLEKKQEGKALGLTFWQCFARNRLYSTSVPGIKPYLYIIPFFLAYFCAGPLPAVYLPGGGDRGG